MSQSARERASADCLSGKKSALSRRCAFALLMLFSSSALRRMRFTGFSLPR